MAQNLGVKRKNHFIFNLVSTHSLLNKNPFETKVVQKVNIKKSKKQHSEFILSWA
jgi:hypothetical protein